jgi:uncharacterized protein (DUF1684 family)
MILALALTGCGSDPAPGPLEMDAAEQEQWEIALVEWRIEKNEGLMQSAESPLPERLREGFEGLDYYFPEKTFRYRVALEPSAGGETVQLQLRKGDAVAYDVRGTVRFRHGGQDLALSVYRSPEDAADALWLPFYDQTNGETTYGGGRYLDLELQADGTVELDFNKAYNPYCAYDAERWNCTLPPAENTLPLRVEAGEKLLSVAGH